jgi:hypothetical protein
MAEDKDVEVIRLGALDFVLYTFLIPVSYLVLKKTVQFVFGVGPSSSSVDSQSTRTAMRSRRRR